MGAKRVEAMSVGGGDERLFEFSRDGCGAPIRIKETRPEMAELYRIETMDSLYQLFAHRTAQHIEWVRRDREHRLAAARAQLFEIVKIPERFDVLRRDIEQNNIRAFEPHFRRRNQQNSHPGGVSENFGPIEDSIVQRDREDAKPEGNRALEQFVRGIVEGVLRVLQGMDMQIELDPFAFSHTAETYTAIRYFGASDERISSKRGSPRKGSQNGISFN